MDDLNPSILDPGVRELVMRLRQYGFHTVDSGDGVSKPSEQRVFDRPHVVMKVADPARILQEALRLQYHLDLWLEPGEWQCEATFNPRDQLVLLFVWDVTDAMLQPDQDRPMVEVVGS